MSRARLLAFLALKGGVGKSTAALHVAADLRRRGYRTLVLDGDSQATAATWASAGQLTFPVERFDLDRPPRQLQLALHEQVKAHQAQLVVLDCAPHLQQPALSVALLADLVVVPVQPSPVDVAATGPTLELVREARRARGGKLPAAALVPYRLQHTSLAAQLPETLAELGEPVAPGVGLRTAVAECSAMGQTVDRYAPHSPAVVEFRALTDFLLNCMAS